MNGAQPAPVQPIQTLVFSGPIQYPATKNFRNACCMVVNSGAQDLRILFSSLGGAVDEGFSLHHFLLALPVELTMHCVGVVESIALVVFMAGKRRFCVPGATFFLHDFTWTSPAPETIARIQLNERKLALDIGRARMKDLLKTKAKFTDEDFTTLPILDQPLFKEADFAKEKGIVHGIEEASIPTGTPVFNVDY